MARRRVRQLTAGEATYRWSVSRRHRVDRQEDGSRQYQGCTERLCIGRDGAPGRLDILFAAGPGRLVPGGGPVPSGFITHNGQAVNLHRPGVVRALLDEAIRHGWTAAEPGRAEYDGWTLLDATRTGPRSVGRSLA